MLRSQIYAISVTGQLCGISMSLFEQFPLLAVQLIDRGKINVRDFASEMDISPDSLEAALVVLPG